MNHARIDQRQQAAPRRKMFILRAEGRGWYVIRRRLDRILLIRILNASKMNYLILTDTDLKIGTQG